MYALRIEYGNGYHCSCCRRTWEDVEEFNTFEEAMKRIAEIEYERENYSQLRELGVLPEGSDADDVDIIDFYETKRPPIRDEDMITSYKKELEEKTQVIVAEKEAKKAKEKAAKAKAKEAHDRKRYKELKEKYEGSEA